MLMPRPTPPPVDPAPIAAPTEDALRSSVPRPLTSFVGREAELAALDALLARGDVGLVTLTGPGGGGKTRIAVALALRQRDRGSPVVYVPLASVHDPALVLPTIA